MFINIYLIVFLAFFWKWVLFLNLNWALDKYYSSFQFNIYLYFMRKKNGFFHITIKYKFYKDNIFDSPCCSGYLNFWALLRRRWKRWEVWNINGEINVVCGGDVIWPTWSTNSLFHQCRWRWSTNFHQSTACFHIHRSLRKNKRGITSWNKAYSKCPLISYVGLS